MNQSADSSPLPAWPFWSPFQSMMNAMAAPNGTTAPSNFSQPILPGWTFGNVISVTEQNSRSPETERNILAAHSYGQQLGRVIDALAALIAERPAGSPKNEALSQLKKLDEKIKAIKVDSAEHRLTRLRTDLEMLKTQRPKEYRRLIDELSQAQKT